MAGEVHEERKRLREGLGLVRALPGRVPRGRSPPTGFAVLGSARASGASAWTPTRWVRPTAPCCTSWTAARAYSDRSKIFVASAWEKLGEYRRSLAACEEVLRLFPELATNFNLLRDQLLLCWGGE